MKPAWGWALAVVVVLAVVVFLVTQGGDKVDPNTAVPRGTNAPVGKDEDAAALAEALRKAKR